MSIYQRLKDDHRDLKHLLTQLDEKSSRSKLKSALFEELKQMVIAHARAEEKVFYDTLKAARPLTTSSWKAMRSIMWSRRCSRR